MFDCSIADHKLIYAVLKLRKSKLPPINKVVRDYKHLNIQNFKSAPWWVCTIFDDIDDIAWSWETMYKNIESDHIKQRKSRVRTKCLPWVDTNIRKLMNKRYRLLKSCDGTNKTSGAWLEYKKIKYEVKKQMRKAEANYLKKQLNEATTPQDFWKLINKIKGKKERPRIGPLRQGEGETITNDKQNRKNDLILIMTPEKQDKTLELSKHWSVDSTPARNEVIMKRTYPVKSVKCDKICSNY